jgi:thiamine biosynthesis lipoprotein
MSVVTLARHAMATRFELVLYGSDPVRLRAAGEEALDEIDRLEAQLSLFRPSSEIAHLNARAAFEPVRVTPGLFALLQHSKKLNTETSGAFDISIAPLVRCWGFMGGQGQVPSDKELQEVRNNVGIDLVQLEPNNLTVRFVRPGVMLDLGAIGKGYAIERAVELLREAGIESALLHGGTSTVYALGQPPEAEQWQVAISDPRNGPTSYPPSGSSQPAGLRLMEMQPKGKDLKVPGPGKPDSGFHFASVGLKDESLSVSAIWGKCFKVDDQNFGHIIDPRTGRPATHALLAAVVLPSATETDALSTALLTLGLDGHEQIAGLRPRIRTLVVGESGGELVIKSKGIIPQSLCAP